MNTVAPIKAEDVDINLKHVVVIIDDNEHETEELQSKLQPTRIVDSSVRTDLQDAIDVRDRMRKKYPERRYEVFTLLARG